MSKLRVLVVDDSSLMRKLISNMIADDDEIEVGDTAINGLFALEKIERSHFDMILLDIEMPQMNGIEFLLKRKEKGIDIPVVVLSSLGRNRPELTLQCIELGASDFILKPSGTISLDIEKVKDEVIAKIKYFAKNKDKQITSKEISETDKDRISDKESRDKKPIMRDIKPLSEVDKVKRSLEENILLKLKRMKSIDIISIGISTGGPNALRQILPLFPEDFPLPILIVQHMPPGFTKEFAKGLNDVCKMTVKEAEEGDIISEGTIFIAPGDKHIIAKMEGGSKIVHLDDGPPVMGHRPSADNLFNSVADLYQNRILAIIMTGMGKDGARGIKRIWQGGGITMAQDEKTCVVFGMPKVAIEYGGIDLVTRLEDIPEKVMDLLKHVNE